MLPKKTYVKVVSSLKKIQKDWDQDRKDNPRLVPYEIDSQLAGAIRHVCMEDRVRCNDSLIEETIDYLLAKKLIVISPYGGIFFENNEVLPSREELIERIKKSLVYPKSKE